MLEEASEQALADGFTPEQIENAKLPDYPPTEADPEWMKGWSQAAAGQTPDTNNTKQRQGYMAWLSRNA